MDNQQLRETYQELYPRACPFEKSILTNQCDCARASRFCIAEREGVTCQSEHARTRCLELLETLRNHARFTLKTVDQQAQLAHGKAMRVQIGGLHGLHKALWPDRPLPPAIGDIDELIERALSTFGSLDDLPFGQVVQQIAAYQPLRRRRLRQR